MYRFYWAILCYNAELRFGSPESRKAVLVAHHMGNSMRLTLQHVSARQAHSECNWKGHTIEWELHCSRDALMRCVSGTVAGVYT